MRPFSLRLPILAASVWAGIGLSVSGMGLGYSETVYVSPTVATVAWPASYVYPRSYVVPTAYSFPSYVSTAYSFPSYVPAAYVDEPYTTSSAYLTTGYTVRRGLLGRLRLVERPVVASYATSYLPSSYIVPTTYVPSVYSPTTYYSTSYLRPSYYATSYSRPRYYTTSYSSPTYVSRTYSPTVFDYPRVYSTSYVTGGSDCEPVPCDGPAVASVYRDSPATSLPEPSAQSYAPPRSNGAAKAIPSTVADDPTFPPNVEPPVPPAPSSRVDPPPASRNAASENRADSPPKPPTPAREQSTAPPVKPAPGGSNSGALVPAPGGANSPAGDRPVAPTAPAGEPAELEPAPPGNSLSNRRETLRPVYSTTDVFRPELRNVLVGRVETDSGEPLGEVAVTVARADDSTIRRSGMTNAFGNFAIRLADGEWNVNVRMPSGRFYTVRSVTVNGGKIVDKQERREVRNLVISY